MIAWTIPLVIIALIVYTFMTNPSAGMQQTVSWIVWNGSLSALGTAIAFGHPLAILTTFIVAPITSLNPLIAAGWFAGIDRKSTRLNSSHVAISYAVFCLK